MLNTQSHIARQAVAVIQCNYDTNDIINRANVDKKDAIVYRAQPTPSLDAVTTRIDVGDLVFHVNPTKLPRGNASDRAIPAISCLNGAYVSKYSKIADGIDWSEADEQVVSDTLSKSIHFLGVALTRALYDPNDNITTKKQFTCQTQGTFTIRNNGNSRLAPGDTLLWDLPTSQDLKDEQFMKNNYEDGKSTRKVVIKTVPMQVARESYTNSVMSAIVGDPSKWSKADENQTTSRRFGIDIRDMLVMAIHEYAKATNPTTTPTDIEDFKKTPGFKTMMTNVVGGDEFPKAISKCVSSFARVAEDLKRRQIGRVLSFAKPGQDVDVLIGC